MNLDSSIAKGLPQNVQDSLGKQAPFPSRLGDHTAFRTDWMPFAGRKHSGYGIGGIGWTMHELTQHKMVVFKR